MPQDILITGGAGYIGAIITSHLLSKGHRVTALDNLSRSNKKRVPLQAKLITADILDQATVNQILTQLEIDTIIHLAALTNAPQSLKQPASYFKTNVVGSHRIITAAVNHDVKNIIFASTAAVYQSSDSPVVEASLTNPANVYGTSKLMTETQLQWFAKTKNINVVVFRFFNAAGASQIDTPPRLGPFLDESNQSIFANLFKVINGEKQSFTLFGTKLDTPDGTAVRDYIHVDDLASAHLKALSYLTSHPGYHLFNIGADTGYSNLEVIDMTRHITQHPIPIIEKSAKPGEVTSSIADSQKAIKTLKWQPSHSMLENIVTSLWDWYCNQAKES